MLLLLYQWRSATGARDWSVDVCVANLFSLHTGLETKIYRPLHHILTARSLWSLVNSLYGKVTRVSNGENSTMC
jgi:hypothetical protein